MNSRPSSVICHSSYSSCIAIASRLGQRWSRSHPHHTHRTNPSCHASHTSSNHPPSPLGRHLRSFCVPFFRTLSRSDHPNGTFRRLTTSEDYTPPHWDKSEPPNEREAPHSQGRPNLWLTGGTEWEVGISLFCIPTRFEAHRSSVIGQWRNDDVRR